MEREDEIIDGLKKVAENLKRVSGIFADVAKESYDNSTAGARLRRDMFSNYESMDEATGKMAATIQKAAKASGHLDRVNQGVVNAISMLGKDVNFAAEALQGFSRTILGGFLGGAFVAGIIGWTKSLTATYREMTEYGQTFSGGIMEMARTAYLGNMSLDEFTRVVKEHSVTLAQIAGNSEAFAKLSADVRKATESMGLYGYTIEGMNDMMLQQLEVMRLNGILENFDHHRVSENMQTLARDTSFLSTAFGKSRREILETSKRAQMDSRYMALMLSKDAKERLSEQERYVSAINFMASQANEAGQILSTFLAQTIGSGGIAAYTDAFRNLFSGMLPEAAFAMERFVQDIEAGIPKDQKFERYHAFIKEFDAMFSPDVMARLRTHAMDETTRQQAESLIAFAAEIKNAANRDIKEAKKQADLSSHYTNNALKAAEVWSRFTTAIQYSFTPLILGPLEAFTKSLERLNSTGMIDKIADSATRLVGRIEDWVSSLNTEDSMLRIQKFAEQVIGSFSKLMTVGSATMEALFGPNGILTALGRVAMTLSPMLIGIADGLLSAANFLLDIFNSFTSALGSFGGSVNIAADTANKFADMLRLAGEYGTYALLGIIAFKKLSGFVQSVANWTGLRTISMAATAVYVSGKTIFDSVGKRFGGRDKDDGDGSPRGRGGRMRRVAGKIAAVGGTLAGSAMMYGSDFISTVSDALYDTGSKVAKGASEAATAAATKASEIASKGAEATAKASQSLFTKGLGTLGLFVEAINATKDLHDLYQRKQSNELTEQQFAAKVVEIITSKVSGAAGAYALGILGAGAGSLIAPGLGSTVGGIAGGVAGFLGGEYIGERIAEAIVKQLATPANPPTEKIAATPDAGALTKDDLAQSQKAFEDKLANWDQNPGGVSMGDVLAKLSSIEQAIRDQTAIEAQLSNRDYREAQKNMHLLSNSLSRISQ